MSLFYVILSNFLLSEGSYRITKRSLFKSGFTDKKSAVLTYRSIAFHFFCELKSASSAADRPFLCKLIPPHETAEEYFIHKQGHCQYTCVESLGLGELLGIFSLCFVNILMNTNRILAILYIKVIHKIYYLL